MNKLIGTINPGTSGMLSVLAVLPEGKPPRVFLNSGAVAGSVLSPEQAEELRGYLGVFVREAKGAPVDGSGLLPIEHAEHVATELPPGACASLVSELANALVPLVAMAVDGAPFEPPVARLWALVGALRARAYEIPTETHAALRDLGLDAARRADRFGCAAATQAGEQRSADEALRWIANAANEARGGDAQTARMVFEGIAAETLLALVNLGPTKPAFAYGEAAPELSAIDLSVPTFRLSLPGDRYIEVAASAEREDGPDELCPVHGRGARPERWSPRDVGDLIGDECTGAGKCHGCLRWCSNCGDVAHVCDARLEGRRCDEHSVPPAALANRRARIAAEQKIAEGKRMQREGEAELQQVVDAESARRAYDRQLAAQEMSAIHPSHTLAGGPYCGASLPGGSLPGGPDISEPCARSVPMKPTTTELARWIAETATNGKMTTDIAEHYGINVDAAYGVASQAEAEGLLDGSLVAVGPPGKKRWKLVLRSERAQSGVGLILWQVPE